ncbi:MAG: HAD family hydrolase [archaeon]|nr:HAD family hydrolase [archaeon]
MSGTLVIWDLDGTFTDSRPWIIESYRHILGLAGLPVPSDEVFSTMMCGSLHDHIHTMFGKHGKEADEIALEYRRYYAENCFLKVELFDGVRETLEELDGMGVTQVVATMKLESAAVELLDRLEVSGHFVTIRGGDPSGKVTKADMIRACVSTGEYSRVVMVGDCPSDMRAAREAGVEFLAAAFGYGYPAERCRSEGLDFVEDIRDVPGFIGSNCSEPLVK